MFHLKLKDTLKHSIATVTSHMDSFVYNPGRDYSRIRKLSPDHVISFLISQGASSTKCEFLDFFQMSEDLPSISALNQRRSQMIDMYALKIVRITTFFAIRPNETRSPSGNENNSVTTKSINVTTIPSPSFDNIIDTVIGMSPLLEKWAVCKDSPF